jgi:hypothetical protein
VLALGCTVAGVRWALPGGAGAAGRTR